MPYVYAFEEGSKEQKFLLGGKGANLAEMTKLGLPVPPGFTITTDACKAYMAAGDTIPDGLMDEVADALAARSRRRWASGSATPPTRCSCRCAPVPPFSMPGMMDTVLNLGLNDVVGRRASRSRPTTSASRTTRTAASCRCSARSCSTSTASSSSTRSTALRDERGVATDPELTRRRPARARRARSRRSCSPRPASSSRRTRREQLALRDRSGVPLVERRARARSTADGEDRRRPRHRGQRADDGVRQQGRRLRHRRRVHAQPGDRREPRRTATSSRTRRAKTSWPASAPPSRSTRWPTSSPSATQQLLGVHGARSSSHYRDMCDIEFTIEQGRLFLLQTRVGKRTAAAALRMAVEMESEGLIDKREAVLRVAARAARPAAAPAVRPDGDVHRARQGPQRVARRGGRQGVLHRRRRRAPPRRRASR